MDYLTTTSRQTIKLEVYLAAMQGDKNTHGNDFCRYRDKPSTWCTTTMAAASYQSSCVVVSFPDPAFTKDKGLAHFARNLGLPDLAGEE